MSRRIINFSICHRDYILFLIYELLKFNLIFTFIWIYNINQTVFITKRINYKRNNKSIYNVTFALSFIYIIAYLRFVIYSKDTFRRFYS